MSESKIIKPQIIVFAGPNGSGKSTITRMAKTAGRYINADEIKSATLCTDLEAAQMAEKLRNEAINDHADLLLRLYFPPTEILNCFGVPLKRDTLSVEYMSLLPILI